MINHRAARVPILASVPFCLAVLGAIVPACVQAEVDFNPMATVSELHDSNVFARPKDEPPFPASGNTELGDTITRYLAGVTGELAFDRDRLSLNAQGAKFDYNRFDELTHYESKFGGLFSYFIGGNIDGNLQYSQSRQMAPLADTLSDQLEIQTEKIGRATARILITPRWRFDLEPNWHDFESPLQAYPEFGFREAGVAGSINYLGIQKLTAGLREEYLDGAYHHIIAATRYRQNITELTASYAVSGFSAFDAQAGYTQRRNDLINPADAQGPGVGTGGVVGTTSAFTGALGFRRQLSVKTSVSLRVFREVDSYVAGANSEIGTGGEFGVRWDPDAKLSFTGRYRLSRQSIQGAVAIADFSTRSDRSRHAEVGMEYRMFRWLSFHPYALYDTRSSNFHDANFNATVYGIDVTAQLHPPK